MTPVVELAMFAWSAMLLWALVNHMLDERLYRPRGWGNALVYVAVGSGPYRSARVAVPLGRAPALVRLAALAVNVTGQPLAAAVWSLGFALVVATRGGLGPRNVDAWALTVYRLSTPLLTRDPAAPRAMLRAGSGLSAGGLAMGGLTAFFVRGLDALAVTAPLAVALLTTGGLLLLARWRHGARFADEPHDALTPANAERITRGR